MTILDLYNLALSNIGVSKRVGSLSENSVERLVCDTHFPICRDSMFERHGWLFASEDFFPPRLSPDDPRYYARPAGCLRINHVEIETTTGARLPIDSPDFHRRAGHSQDWALQFKDGQQAFVYLARPLSDTERLVINGVCRIEDPALWPSYFIDAVAIDLAVRISTPITKNPQLAEKLGQFAQSRFFEAATIDAQQRQTFFRATPESAECR